MFRKLVNLVFFLVILAGAALLAKELVDSREPLNAKPRQSKPPLVQVHTLEQQGAQITLRSHGTVQAKTSLQLTSDVAGRVIWVNPALVTGVILAPETPIARIDKTQYELALAQAVIYLALAPKSNAAYAAYKNAVGAAKKTGSEPPPKHILNAPTRLMKDQGYGAGYAYDHDAEDGFSGQDYFPETMERTRFYDPPDRGFEREMRKRLDWFDRLREKRRGSDGG